MQKEERSHADIKTGELIPDQIETEFVEDKCSIHQLRFD